VEDVVQIFPPAKKARAKRKLGSDRISKAKQTKERYRRSRPGDSDDDSDYEDDEGCDKLSSDDKSKGKAKAKAKGKGKQPKGKGKAKAMPRRRPSNQRGGTQRLQTTTATAVITRATAAIIWGDHTRDQRIFKRQKNFFEVLRFKRAASLKKIHCRLLCGSCRGRYSVRRARSMGACYYALVLQECCT
jgi:hypothetical protein